MRLVDEVLSCEAIPSDLRKRIVLALTAKATRQKPPADEHECFFEFWCAYPKRAGTNSRKNASARFTAAVCAGAASADIIAGACAYAAQCDAMGKTGTEYVQQAETWLNQRGWESDYSARPTGRQSRFTAIAEDLRGGGRSGSDRLCDIGGRTGRAIEASGPAAAGSYERWF